MRIDSHQHFWLHRHFDYPWMDKSNSVVYRDYLPENLKPLLRENNIDQTIAVQASPTLEETDFLLALAKDNFFIAGVVGWLDLESEHFPDQLEQYCKYSGFVGIRPAVELIDDIRWLVRPSVLRSLQEIAKKKIPLDLIVWPQHLPSVIEMLTKIPDLLGVIDHLAKPNIQDNCLQPWKTHITEISKYPGLHCKLSGMFPRANLSIDISKQVQPFVSHLLRCFGEDRLMFGSDWPVCLTSSDYKSSIEVIKKTVSCHLSTKVETAIFGGNAIKFYRLDGAEK